jgi:hypothetical protein
MELKPNAIVYNIEQYGLSDTRELAALRLIIQGQERYYVFLDFRREERLKETGIPVSGDKRGNRYIDEEAVKSFLRTHIGDKNITFCSYWNARLK